MLEVLEQVKTSKFPKIPKNINFILNQVSCEIDACIIPVGGGGLLAGSCLTASYMAPNVQMIGAEPSTKADLKKSLQIQKHTPCVINI